MGAGREERGRGRGSLYVHQRSGCSVINVIKIISCAILFKFILFFSSCGGEGARYRTIRDLQTFFIYF